MHYTSDFYAVLTKWSQPVVDSYHQYVVRHPVLRPVPAGRTSKNPPKHDELY